MAFFQFRKKDDNPERNFEEIEDKEELVLQIEKAKNDWNLAHKRLNELSDPELIDYAVYSLQAAEKRYMYLLKRAQKIGVCRFNQRKKQSRA